MFSLNLKEMKQRWFDAIAAYVAEGGIDPYLPGGPTDYDATPAVRARYERSINEVIDKLFDMGYNE